MYKGLKIYIYKHKAYSWEFENKKTEVLLAAMHRSYEHRFSGAPQRLTAGLARRPRMVDRQWSFSLTSSGNFSFSLYLRGHRQRDNSEQEHYQHANKNRPHFMVLRNVPGLIMQLWKLYTLQIQSLFLNHFLLLFPWQALPGDSSIRGSKSDARDANLDHQLGSVIKLNPYLTTCKLKNKNKCINKLSSIPIL